MRVLMTASKRKLLRFYALLAMAFIALNVMLIQPLQWARTSISESFSHENRKRFNETFFTTDINGKFDPSGINQVCEKKMWKEGLVMQCFPPEAGYTNVRNALMNCLRFSIEAGAGGIIVPQLVARNKSDLLSFDTTAPYLPFDAFFDTDHFIKSLDAGCPQMHVYRSIDDLRVHSEPTLLHPLSIIDGTDKMPIHTPETWGANFEKWLKDQSGYPAAEHGHFVVTLEATLLAWPVEYDSQAFREQFGRLFIHRPDIRMMAADMLYTMVNRYGLSQDALTGNSIGYNQYYGAHLRVEADAASLDWPTYEKMAPRIIADAVKRGLRVIYVACGSFEHIELLKKDALKENQIVVVSKADLLSRSRLKQLRTMTFDEHALLDEEMLVRSSRFGGAEHSSFSWNIALRRHVVAERTEEPAMYELEEDQCLHDMFSVMFGARGAFPMFKAALWP